MSDTIQFLKDDNNITIVIPIHLLKYAAENNPGYPLIIKDEQQFAEKVLFILQHDEDPDTGLTGLQRLLDNSMEEVAGGWS